MKNELTCLSSFPCLCHSKLAGRQLESIILNLWYLKKPALWICAFRHAPEKVCKDQWKLLLYWETPPSFSELNVNSLHSLLHISSNFSSDNVYIFLSSHFQHAKHFVAVFRRTCSLVTAGSERVKIQLNNLEYINNHNSEYICSDEGLTLETSALKLSTVANLHCQLGCNIKFHSNKIRAWRVHSKKVGNQYTGTFYFIFMCSLIPFILESRI